MPNPMKRKGSDFERQAVEILNSTIKDASFKKVPGSGALGTSLFEPTLTADIIGKVKSIHKSFKIECKVGYNSSTDREVKQFTLKKEWLDKVRKEADATFSIPLLMGKFSNVRDGVRVFVTMDVEIFSQIINELTKYSEEAEYATALSMKLTEQLAELGAVPEIKEKEE